MILIYLVDMYSGWRQGKSWVLNKEIALKENIRQSYATINLARILKKYYVFFRAVTKFIAQMCLSLMCQLSMSDHFSQDPQEGDGRYYISRDSVGVYL
jgi:hypothetical protein